MAKRRRLDPAQGDYLAGARAPEVKSMFPAPPIAQVAGEAAAASALREVAGELAAARAEGRILQRLPLDLVEVDHLVRDRISVVDDEMEVLMASIRARGQQTPIEVVDLATGRFGLISGWRRLRALQLLAAEPDGGRFDTVLALLRKPETAAEAYIAMVEENEIRIGLSYYERARIAARAAELRVYATPQEAIRALFASASRAKRSKIASFLRIYQELDGALRFPTSLGERFGLQLSTLLEKYEGFGARLGVELNRRKPATEQEEVAILNTAVFTSVMLPQKPKIDAPLEEWEDAPDPNAPSPLMAAIARMTAPGPLKAALPESREIAPGIWMQTSGPDRRQKLTIYGPKVDVALRARLEAWLQSLDAKPVD